MAIIGVEITSKSEEGIKAILKLTDAQKKAEEGAKRHNSATREHGAAMGDAAKNTEKATDAVKGFVAGAAGLVGVSQVFGEIQKQISASREAMAKLGDEGLTASRKLLGLSDQLGIEVARSAALVNTISRATGATAEVSSAAALWTDKLLGQSALKSGVAEVIAGGLASGGDEAGGAKPIAELMRRYGVTNKQEGARIFAILSQLEKARFGSEAESADLIVRGEAAGITAGLPIEDAVGLLVSAKEATGSDRAARSMLATLFKAQQSKSGRRFIEGVAGQDYGDLSDAERNRVFISALQGAKTGDLDDIIFENEFSGAEAAALRGLSTPAAKSAFQAARDRARSATGAEAIADIERFVKTPVGQAAIDATNRDMAKAQQGGRQKFQTLIQAAIDKEALWTAEKKWGLASNVVGSIPIMGAAEANRRRAVAMAAVEIERLTGDLYDGPIAGGSGYYEPTTGEISSRSGIGKRLADLKRSRGIPLNQRIDVGGQPFSPTAGTTIINNYGDNNFLGQQSSATQPAAGAPAFGASE